LLWVAFAASRTPAQWLGLAGQIQSAAHALDGSPIDRNIQMLLIAAGLVVLFKRGEQVTGVLRMNGAILAFLAYCAVSVLWSDFPGVAFKRWFKAFGEFVMVLVVVTDPYRHAAIERLLTRFGVLLLLLSILFIKYYPALGQQYYGSQAKVRYTGVALEKNALGTICAIAGIACVWRLLRRFRTQDTNRGARLLIAPGITLAAALWLFSKAGSMTALSCFMIGNAVLVMMTTVIGQKRALTHLLVVLTLCMAAASLFLNAGVVEALGRDPTLTGRTELWGRLVGMTPSPALGAGFESFWSGKRLERLWSIYWWTPNESHNGYLEIFLNLGFVGLAFFIAMVLTGYRNLVRTIGDEPELCALRLAFFVAGLADGLTEAAFRVSQPFWIMFLMAIVAVPTVPMTTAAVSVRTLPPRRSTWTRAAASAGPASRPRRSGAIAAGALWRAKV